VQQWEEQFLKRPTINGCFIQSYIAAKAAQWGANQELEACCELLPGLANYLRAGRRPKPPSLRKQAYDALDTYIYGEPDSKDKERTYNTIRRALEALND
jgi:hypothetical protein